MSTEKPKKLVLVDGSSYLFRAFHALPPLSSNGHQTGAMYGVINMIRKLINDEHPDRIAVVFDAKGPTFRNELYEDYKANRPPMPEELAEQIEPLHEIIRAQGLPLIIVDGVEADDVIGTLARQAREQGYEVLISTGDKDMAQLVQPGVTLIDTMNDRIMDEAMVREKFGVEPDQIIDYLALMGDASDNIPGVPKVGPKTAAKWLKQYGSLDAIMEHADEFKGKIGEHLRASLDFLPLSRELATIKRDLDLDIDIDDLKPGEADSERLRELFRRYNFRRWLEELEEGGNQGAAARQDDDREYETVLDEAALERWIERLKQAEAFAVDTETTSLDYMDAELVGISLSVEPGKAAYIPLAHRYPGAPEQLDRDRVVQRLKPLLTDAAIGKIGQNIKYDEHVFHRCGVEIQPMAHDTMLQSYVLDSTATRHNMDDLARYYLGLETTHYEDVAGKGARQIGFDQVALEQAAPYACEDADITLRLHRELLPRLEQEPKLLSVYRDIEMPLVPVLLRMEQRGVIIDRGLLEQQGIELEQQMKNIEAKIHELAGEPFNLGSPKQIQAILFDKLQLPVIRKTPKGQPSTAEDVLEELAQDYEIPRLILDYRSLSKLKNTYIDKLPKMIHPHTGRVHTTYQQAVTSTGRLSSTNPNLQNIPVRTPEGRRIREAFIAPPGCKIMALDYSQIELRIMAHLSGDENLLHAFEIGEDVHRHTAAEVFGVSIDAVTPDQRRAAKAINFGLIYGMSAFGLGKQLGIGRNEAQAYVDLYFERYPGVKRYMEETRQRAHELGYVETVFGRRLYLPELKSRNPQQRQYAERTAINAPMQGTAADIIKRAMVAVDDYIQSRENRVHMVMQVHDELVFEIEEQEIDHSRDRIAELMTGAAELKVRLVVDIGVGDNWNEAH